MRRNDSITALDVLVVLVAALVLLVWAWATVAHAFHLSGATLFALIVLWATAGRQ